MKRRRGQAVRRARPFTGWRYWLGEIAAMLMLMIVLAGILALGFLIAP